MLLRTLRRCRSCKPTNKFAAAFPVSKDLRPLDEAPPAPCVPPPPRYIGISTPIGWKGRSSIDAFMHQSRAARRPPTPPRLRLASAAAPRPTRFLDTVRRRTPCRCGGRTVRSLCPLRTARLHAEPVCCGKRNQKTHTRYRQMIS
eukprot:COSAG02_NODE_649_length_18914_cov_30.645868_7_plen_145_part_00